MATAREGEIASSHEKWSQSLQTFKLQAPVPVNAQVVTMTRTTLTRTVTARPAIASAAAVIGRVAARYPTPRTTIGNVQGNGNESKVVRIPFHGECDDGFEQQDWTGHDHPHRARVAQ